MSNAQGKLSPTPYCAPLDEDIYPVESVLLGEILVPPPLLDATGQRRPKRVTCVHIISLRIQTCQMLRGNYPPPSVCVLLDEDIHPVESVLLGENSISRLVEPQCLISHLMVLVQR